MKETLLFSNNSFHPAAMSSVWAFSSFGLFPEEKSEDNLKEKCSHQTKKDEEDIFSNSDKDHDMFCTEKPRLPMMIKRKPMKRFLPEVGNQLKTDFRDIVHAQREASVIPIHKRLNSTKTNKCKWTRAINSRFLVKVREMKEFFRLAGDPVISDFLKMDSCKRIADKYLIAMVFAYFKRADFSLQDYTRTNFFIALYLANDVEEDEEEIKYEILPWALGKSWRDSYVDFLRKRDLLFKRIEYKAIISRKCCDEIMNIEPDNSLWKRERCLHHAGAIRGYMKDPKDNGMPRGPDASPLFCPECDISDSQYDSASSNSLSWLISPCDSPNH